MNVAVAELAAPFGPLSIAAGDDGVIGVSFGPADDLVAELADQLPRAEFDSEGPAVAGARAQLADYIAGRRDTFDVAIDWRRVKGFRRAVLETLYETPFGTTVSYRDLACALGKPGAARAVGTAMANNPYAVIVPCHRVIRTGGAIGGFGGARNALDIKRWLLAREGVQLV